MARVKSKSREAANDKMKNIGQAKCDICGIFKLDVVSVKKNWFTTLNVCDTCGREMFLRYSGKVGGEKNG